MHDCSQNKNKAYLERDFLDALLLRLDLEWCDFSLPSFDLIDSFEGLLDLGDFGGDCGVISEALISFVERKVKVMRKRLRNLPIFSYFHKFSS